jgi:hypothetical protein
MIFRGCLVAGSLDIDVMGLLFVSQGYGIVQVG